MIHSGYSSAAIICYDADDLVHGHTNIPHKSEHPHHEKNTAKTVPAFIATSTIHAAISIEVAQQRRSAEMTQTMKAVIKKFVAFVPGYLMLQSHAQHCNKSRSPLLRRPTYTPMPSLLHAPCHASSAHCAQSHDADPPSLVQHQSTRLSSVMCCIPVDPRVDQILHIVLSARVVRRIGGSWV